jgi:transposase
MAKLERKNAWLQAEVEALFRKLFRKRSEKLDPRQLELVFEAMRDLGISQHQLEQLEHEVEVGKHRRRGTPVRQALPKDLPRERVEHALPEHERCCSACGEELTKIREEVTEQLDYTPASFKVIEHVRGVFACKSCEETITRAPKPPQAIEKGLPGPGLLAQVMVSKYCDHQPLYRQAQIYGRHGVTLSRSTLCGWVADAAELVSPLVDWMRRDLLRSRIVQTDDTPVTVLDDQGGTHKGRLWVYLGDRGHPHIVYDYTPTREGTGPTRFLNGFRGYLQADAYSGYDAVYASGSVFEVGCRVGGGVTAPTPHRPGLAGFPHPVLHGAVSLAVTYWWTIRGGGRGCRWRRRRKASQCRPLLRVRRASQYRQMRAA